MIMRTLSLVLAASSLLGASSSLAAQSGATGPEPPTARVAVLPASLYTEQANLQEATDTAQADVATEVIRARLAERLGPQVVAYPIVDSLASLPEARALAGGAPCQVKVACAVAVGRSAGAGWVVMTKVSKTSNLIWLLSAQLVRVATGEIVLDDSTELKGEPAPMIRIGVRNFADRVARTVLAGGRTTDFPNGEPRWP